MATEEGPSKVDINAVFKKLRSAAANKVCFDCGAKNPTWSSVTYGVFICIDCSAIHRGLGVHVSFVRSTQLDTNWTWLQLRAMQCGGNANATQFFRQHSCTSTDAQQKYKSRAASLYKEKLHQSAVAAMRLHGYKLHIDSASEQMSPTEKVETDFFEEHWKEEQNDSTSSDSNLPRNQSQVSMSDDAYIISHVNTFNVASADDGIGPSVDHLVQAEGEKAPMKVSSIGQRKPAGAKKTMGGVKKGLGAQKVDANFSKIEQEAESIERSNLATVVSKPDVATAESGAMSARLMVQDIGASVKKRDEQNKNLDPKKFEQAERLGMGSKAGKSGVSHSVIADMKSIQNENGNKSSFDTALKVRDITGGGRRGSDDWEVLDAEPSSRDVRKSNDDFFDAFSDLSTNKSKDVGSNWGSSSTADKYRNKPVPVATGPSSEEALKKFGNAKAISSDQFFGDKGSNFETRSNFNRFEGQSAISSADFFGDPDAKQTPSARSYGVSAPDVADIKDSVRTGVTKVAGKLSQFSSSVSSYISQNYN